MNVDSEMFASCQLMLQERRSSRPRGTLSEGSDEIDPAVRWSAPHESCAVTSFAGVAQIRDRFFAIADDDEFEHAVRLCLAGSTCGDRPAEDAAGGARTQRLLRFVLQLDAEVVGAASGDAEALPRHARKI